MDIFGFTIKRKDNQEKTNNNLKPLSVEHGDDAGIVVSGQRYGVYYDLSYDKGKKDAPLIRLYRDVAQHPEVDSAIDDIVNEAIVTDDDSPPIDINLDDVDLSESIKTKIREEFESIVKMLNFNWIGADLFRLWYIDGRIYVQKLVDEKNPKKGIQELRLIDATKIKKVKEVEKKKDAKSGGEYISYVDEYFVYTESGTDSDNSTGLKINKDAITECTSGLLDSSRTKTISYLHKAIKPVNQLRMMEDALVVYRLSRAPERRIFYIDVGNLPKNKAEQYLNTIMENYKNRIVYNSETGSVETKNHHMTMMEDFWLPRREGGRGTEISTLPGGENLGQIEDILFFQKKLYKSLNVPYSRMDNEQQAMVSLGRTSEITRDELKFQKFVNKLRKRFSLLFIDLLKTQVILKGILTEREWDDIKQDVLIDFLRDSHFAEMKNAELLREKIATLREVDEYVGRYYSKEWVRKNILLQTDEEIKEIDKQIEAEPSIEDELEESTEKEDKTLIETIDPIREREIEESQLKLIKSMTRFIDEI